VYVYGGVEGMNSVGVPVLVSNVRVWSNGIKKEEKDQSCERALSLYANEIYPLHWLAVGVYPVNTKSTSTMTNCKR